MFGDPPPTQKVPIGQVRVEVREVEPAGQKEPGAALQKPEHKEVRKPVVLPKVPDGHGEQTNVLGLDEFLKVPRGQSEHGVYPVLEKEPT